MAQNETDNKEKIFNDPIHGNISFNSACVAIINTPQFQRLRYLKQQGAVYSVYPGAGHNRFEHSLGVCYLAGRLMRHLKKQEDLQITDQDVLCVQIAGLCHDLGHGPFSHTFDGRFIPAVAPGTAWTHEDASKTLFHHLVDKYELIEEGGALYKHGLRRIDVQFINELISPEAWGPSEGWPNKGRGKEKAFLYEIISNKRTGIDVDKFEYLARDCNQAGIPNNFDHKRFIKFTRVIDVGGQRQICLRDKEVQNLYNMFSTRYNLHKFVCQHRVVSAVDLMVTEAMIKSNDHVFIKGRNGRKRKMSECIDDMEAYTQLNDSIIFKILYTESDNPDMKAAQELIQRVFRRDLYKCVYESPPIDPKILGEKTGEVIKSEIIKMARAASTQVQDGRIEMASAASTQVQDGRIEMASAASTQVQDGRIEMARADSTPEEGELIVEILKLDFGKGVKDPMQSLNVYSRDNLGTGRRLEDLEVSRMMPLSYSERIVRVYTRRARPTEFAEREIYDKQLKDINEACKKWFKEKLTQVVWADGVPSHPDPDGGAQVPETSGRCTGLHCPGCRQSLTGL